MDEPAHPLCRFFLSLLTNGEYVCILGYVAEITSWLKGTSKLSDLIIRIRKWVNSAAYENGFSSIIPYAKTEGRVPSSVYVIEIGNGCY